MNLFPLLMLGFTLTIAAIPPVFADESDQALAPPVFSHESGFHEKEFKLRISHPDPDVEIYYTLDGSDPDPGNLGGKTFRYKNSYAQPPATEPTGEFLYQEYRTHRYSKPLRIVDRTYEPDRLSQISTTFDETPTYFPEPKPAETIKNSLVDVANSVIHFTNRVVNRLERYARRLLEGKGYQHEHIHRLPLMEYVDYEYLHKGTPVRAIAVGPGSVQSPEVSGVFFIGDQEQFSLPIINLTIPEKELFDYEEGIFVAGEKYEQWLASREEPQENPPWWVWDANWAKKHRSKKLLSYLTIFDPSAGLVENQAVGVSGHGSSSSAYRNKMLRVYPRKKFSSKGIAYDLFSSGESVGLNRVILRNAGQKYATTFITDVALQRSLSSLKFGTQRFRPIVLFINGEYQGVRHARDRRDRYYIESMYNLPDKKIDHLKRNSVVVDGDRESWGVLNDYIREGHKLKELGHKIDLESFIDYFSSEIYVANPDWPSNNIAYWRYKASNSEKNIGAGNIYTDGRWRWLMYDLDHAAGNVSSNTLLMAVEGVGPGGWGEKPGWSTFLLSSLLDNREFRQLFITRFSDLLNSTFLPERMTAIIRDTQAMIAPEMPRHIHRWSAPRSMEYWEKSMDELVEFFEQRPAHQWKHLQEFFDLGPLYTVKVELAEEETGVIELNTLTLGESSPNPPSVTDTPLDLPWQGQYFQGLPLKVRARPIKGYRFSHWESGELDPKQSTQASITFDHPDQKVIELRAVMVREEG